MTELSLETMNINPKPKPPRTNWRVPFVGLKRQYQGLRKEILTNLDRIFSEASFILRDDVDKFEKRFAAFIGTEHAIGVNSGTDALLLSMDALEIGSGDEVITVAHTCLPTVNAIVKCGAKPVLVDISNDFNMDAERIEAAITDRTKAIVPVHQNGRMCDMEKMMEIGRQHDLIIIEDSAQALGARHGEKPAGSVGNVGCFSLHPMKVLSVGGDGGVITTNDSTLARQLRTLRNVSGLKDDEGPPTYGYNSRLDTLHAAVALVKMDYLSEWLESLRRLAKRYDHGLADLPNLHRPPSPKDGARYDIFSSYVVRTTQRDALMSWLKDDGIEVFALWTCPLHLKPNLGLSNFTLPQTEQLSNEVLSLPIYPQLTDKEQDIVIGSIHNFFRSS